MFHRVFPAAFAALQLACGSGAPASVSILAPAEQDSTARDVLVRLGVAGARAVAADGRHVEGEGHHHLFLDVDPSPLGQPIPKGDAIFHLGSGADTLRLTGLAPDPHRLIAVFASGDHVPMPAIRLDTVHFIVR